MASLRNLVSRRRRREPETSITYSYEPSRDGDADPGEVVWGWVAYEDDPTQGKDRPILVVGRQDRDVVGVRLTSKERPGDPDQLPVGAGGWDQERRPSFACLDRVLRFAPHTVRREGAALDQRRFHAVVDELRRRQAAGPG